MGSGNPSSQSDSSADASPGSGASADSGVYEKWLVRILLGLAFGLAFGIEGMTLVRSYVLDRDAGRAEDATEDRAALREGDVLVPGTSAAVRVRQLHVRATDEAWTFVLRADPDSVGPGKYTISLDELTADDGTVYSDPIRHTWAPSDTASFKASWSLRPGQRPARLTMTATMEVTPDSTVSGTRTVTVGHVPIQQGQD
ncbi:MAG: hypothetical protein ACLFTE_09835 [Salinivenus sp.]